MVRIIIVCVTLMIFIPQMFSSVQGFLYIQPQMGLLKHVLPAYLL